MDFDAFDYEDPHRYVPGGYHPVHLGDYFNNDRYLVVHKLGFGTYATSEEGQFLRRLSPPESKGGSSILSFWQPKSNPSDSSLFPTLLDEFTIHGPNGNHQCLVTDVFGPSIRSLQNYPEYYRLPLEVARRVTVQLAHGVAKIHECGIVHGDLHPGNILFCIPVMESWTLEQFYTYFDRPQKVNRPITDHKYKVLLPPNAPLYFVCRPSAKNLIPLCLDSASIRIVDFGEAFFSQPQGVDKLLGVPPGFGAPEVLFKDVVTAASDIWSLACLTFCIISDHELWNCMDGSLEDILLHFTTTYGKLPQRWWNKWENRAEFFEEDGTVAQGGEYAELILADTKDLEIQVTKELLSAPGATLNLGEEEMAQFAKLILAMCKLEPGERINAKEVLKLLPTCWTAAMKSSG